MRIDFATLWRTLVALILLSPLLAQADGQAELKDALARHVASAPFRSQVEVKTWKRDGEGKSAEERSGQAGVLLEESAAGMRIQFSRDSLNRLNAEEQAKEKDAKAKTPTLAAFNALNATELRQLANAAPGLLRLLDKVTFKSERTEQWNGKSTRVLSFDLGLATVSEKDRKYVTRHEGTLDVWIAADGTPLASRQHMSVSGRAYVVVSFDGVSDEDTVYVSVGDRLLAARKEQRSTSSGAGEHNESRTTRTLSLLP